MSDLISSRDDERTRRARGAVALITITTEGSLRFDLNRGAIKTSESHERSSDRGSQNISNIVHRIFVLPAIVGVPDPDVQPIAFY